MKKLSLTLVALVASMSMSAQILTVVKDGQAVMKVPASDVDKVIFEEAIPEPQLVDLGLSVKWATFNVGASNPKEVGFYFAWGEIQGYSKEAAHNFGWATYKWGTENNFTKYNANDNKKVLDATDDAARAYLGGSWRMPTREEQEELFNESNCTLTWCDNYENSGVKGYKITSKKTGFTDKFIFLPATGYFTNVFNSGDHCYYWSSSLSSGSTNTASSMNLYSSDRQTHYDTRRFGGLCVRAVCPK